LQITVTDTLIAYYYDTYWLLTTVTHTLIVSYYDTALTVKYCDTYSDCWLQWHRCTDC
jgi:hypothetical protein